MSVLNTIIECEIKYAKCFCEENEQQGFIRFQDDLIPDMYYHNYTWLKYTKDDAAFIQLIESEIAYRKNAGKDFCLLRCHVPVNRALLTQLPHTPEISISGYYVFDVSKLSTMTKNQYCNVVKADTDEMIDDIVNLDLEHDEESLGRDFCIRRVYRRKNMYLSNESLDSYICYHNNKAVGNCELFIYNGTAKIENFAVSPQNQRQGYGTTILKSLIEIALNQNATTIYLEADEEDTVKEMYQKCGFYKVDEFIDLFFKF